MAVLVMAAVAMAVRVVARMVAVVLEVERAGGEMVVEREVGVGVGLVMVTTAAEDLLLSEPQEVKALAVDVKVKKNRGVVSRLEIPLVVGA